MAKVDFVVGEDDFSDIQIVRHLTDQLHGFRKKSRGDIVRFFVLRKSKHVNHVCEVTLILKSGAERFTPRLAFSIRHQATGDILDVKASDHDAKGRVDLTECHENYWKLISCLRSLRELDIPDEHFSLTPNTTSQIRAALSDHDVETFHSLAKIIEDDPTFSLSIADVVELNRRRIRLAEFQKALSEGKTEPWWKDFFENNKWIFGYGLNYRIIRVEQEQANLGGAIFTGVGTKKADYLGSTSGDVRFTIVVEIKTAETPLLQGDKPQRSGAWSLSKQLIDAVTQAQAYAYGWTIESKQFNNVAELAKRKLFTVQPRAIVVIGRLADLASDETKLSTFELFRESLHGVEVITYDQLQERAKFIVENMKSTPQSAPQ